MMHHSTKFGNTMFGGLEDIILTNIDILTLHCDWPWMQYGWTNGWNNSNILPLPYIYIGRHNQKKQKTTHSHTQKQPNYNKIDKHWVGEACIEIKNYVNVITIDIFITHKHQCAYLQCIRERTWFYVQLDWPIKETSITGRSKTGKKGSECKIELRTALLGIR